MDIGLQCNLWSDQRNVLLRLEDRIIESQKHLFLKTEKLLKSQNEKTVRLIKLVDDQSERIGALDARLEIIYRFLNKEIKDVEGRILSSMDTMSSSFTNQLVYSFPYALSPAMTALSNIMRKLEILCIRDDFDKSNITVDVVQSDPVDDSEARVDVPTEPVREISKVESTIEYMEGSDKLMLVKSEENNLVDEILEVNCNIVTKQSVVNTVSTNNNTEVSTSCLSSSGLKFILKSLGLPENDSGVGDVNAKNEDLIKSFDIPLAREKNLKRKTVKCENKHDECDASGSSYFGNVEMDYVETALNDDGDLEDGEIMDDEQEVTVVPIGRVTVKTSGLFKDETMPKKKRRTPQKNIVEREIKRLI